ncbi:NUDIX domain-containing protein [Microbacterium sp. NPDC058342]|uniref:NUDIX domain-containing protein n=1 Tax=Microbacterium sp. NPDC058342 TaxID=3346454 RepID=UPI003660693A
MAGDAPMRVAGTAVVLRDSASGVEALLLRRPASGSFPGAWVFPGGRVDPVDSRNAPDEAEAARRAAVRETHEEAGIRIGELALLSRWTPPPETPVKFRTWFFLARDPGDAVVINPGEIEEAAWLTIERIFDGHVGGLITLVPPTWVTLHGLRAARTVDEAFDALGEPEHFATRVTSVDGGSLATWAGDEEYPDAPGVAGARHRLLMGALPWTYERR